MCFNKTLLKNVEDYEWLKKRFGDHTTPHTRWNLYEPEKYPCIACYGEWDNPNGPIEVEGDYIYLDDFGDDVLKGVKNES